jgi:hypothetical protein
MSERDAQRSANYFFPPSPNFENRLDESSTTTMARDTMNPAVVPPTWHLAPIKNLPPLTALGRLLGGADIKKPSPQEIAAYLANVKALDRPHSFDERWSDVMPQFDERWSAIK